MMNQDQGGRLSDVPPVQGDAKRPTDAGVQDWNKEATGRTERPLSVEERAERASVAHPDAGFGFHFDSDLPAGGERDRFDRSLNAEQRAALKDPRATVTITATTSRTGPREYNQDLSQRRGDSIARLLKESYGAKANIVVEALGCEPAEDRGAPRGQDNRNDRVALVDISLPPGAKSGEKPRDPGKQPDKGLTEMPRLPRQYNAEKELGDFLKNPPIGEGAIAKSILKLGKLLVDSIGELHDANVKAARLVGTFYSLNIIGRDAGSASNPHVQQGKPYSAAELRDRTWRPYGDQIESERTQLGIQHGDVSQDVNRGIAAVADAANAVLKLAKTPAERRTALGDFANSTQTKIREKRAQRLREVEESKKKR